MSGCHMSHVLEDRGAHSTLSIYIYTVYIYMGVARNPGMDRVWVWVCDPSLMFLAVAIYRETHLKTTPTCDSWNVPTVKNSGLSGY